MKISTKLVDISDLQVVRDYLMSLIEPDIEVILMNGKTPFAKLLHASDLPTPNPDRAPDLYPALWVSDDFCDLLPGEYWLTEQS